MTVPAGLTDVERFDFGERAAIREYDGCQSREVAEAGAAQDVLARRAAKLSAPRRTLGSFRR